MHCPTAAGDLGSVKQVQPYDAPDPVGGSTDVADVSWTVPAVGLNTATFVPGSPRPWSATASRRSTIA